MMPATAAPPAALRTGATAAAAAAAAAAGADADLVASPCVPPPWPIMKLFMLLQLIEW